jgi:hypothetical protein
MDQDMVIIVSWVGMIASGFYSRFIMFARLIWRAMELTPRGVGRETTFTRGYSMRALSEMI